MTLSCIAIFFIFNTLRKVKRHRKIPRKWNYEISEILEKTPTLTFFNKKKKKKHHTLNLFTESIVYSYRAGEWALRSLSQTSLAHADHEIHQATPIFQICYLGRA